MRHLGRAAGLITVAAGTLSGAPLAPPSSAATVVDLAVGACMKLEASAPLRPASIDPRAAGKPAGPKGVELKLDPSAVLVPSSGGAVYFQVVGPRCQIHAEGVDPAAVNGGVEAALSGLEFRKATPDATSARPEGFSITYVVGDMGLPRIPAIMVRSPPGRHSVDVTVAMMRQINVTTDSASGWQPSDEQADQAVAAIRKFLAAKDNGSAEDAYRMTDAGFRRQAPLADYLAENQKFRGVSGRVIERRIVRLTWTKDPAQAPYPGVYAAADLVSRFQNVDRHCGYIVAYQSPHGGAFEIMREESNYMLNSDARQIAAGHSQAEVDRIWAQLSANCPNFPASGR